MNAKAVKIDSVAIDVLLARQQLTRQKLAEKAEIDKGNLSTMLKRGFVRPKTAGRIATALGVDVIDIIELPENER